MMLNNNERKNDVSDPVKEEGIKRSFQLNETLGENYSIYNFFKSYPASAIAAFSTFVAIITFFGQLITYIINKNILEYWGYNISYASLGSDGFLYSAISAIVYGVIISSSVVWFLKTSDVYLERKRCFLTAKYSLKQQRKCEKEKIKKIRLAERVNNENKDFDKTKLEIVNTIKKYKYSYKSIRKEIFWARFLFLKNLIPILIILGFCAFIMSLMLAQNIQLWLSMICILIIQLVTFFILYRIERKSVLRKKQIKKIVETLEPKEILENAKYKTKYPLESLRFENKGVKNSTFFKLVVYVFGICIVLVAMSGFYAKEDENQRKTFGIVNLEGEEYSIIHHNKDAYFLEKVSISHNELTIYINHQRIVYSSDISFEVRTFDKVIKEGEVFP